MYNKKKILIIIPFLIAIALVLFVYSLKITADKRFAEGNYQLASAQYSKALKSCNTAKSLWPFISNDPTFQRNRELVQSFFDDLKNSPAVTVFLKSTATQEDINSLMENIKQMDGVKDVKFISKDEALRRYKEKNKNDELLLELVTADILPESIEIYTIDMPSIEQQNAFNSLRQNSTIIERAIQSSFRY